MDVYLRALERKAKLEGEWAPFAHALLRLLNDQQPPATTLYAAVQIKNNRAPNVSLFATMREALKHQLEAFLGEVESVQLSDLDRADYEEVVQLAEQSKYQEAWDFVEEQHLSTYGTTSYYISEHQMSLEKA